MNCGKRRKGSRLNGIHKLSNSCLVILLIAGDKFEARFGPQVYFLATLEDGWKFAPATNSGNQLKRQDSAVRRHTHVNELLESFYGQ